MLPISISRDYTDTPGPRFRNEGGFSGEQFLEEILEPKYLQAVAAHDKLIIDLDGTEGYATSFLEAAFGGLGRKYDPSQILDTIRFKCDDEPMLEQEIITYIKDSRRK
jgi:STAS-like domain of unknown function (DUF4325)